MNMGTSSMTMTIGTSTINMVSTATGTAAAATTSAMSMSMGGDCKISMLWNWYTVDSCFIARSWRITSHGMFAGSCIGVILLVVLLEFFRRFAKEYDRYILRAHLAARPLSCGSTSCNDSDPNDHDPSASLTKPNKTPNVGFRSVGGTRDFRPSVLQQAVRALLHLVQFALAYFVMLLAMYYNGYIIICILIGAFLGSFVFSWEKIALDGPEEEVTVCCG